MTEGLAEHLETVIEISGESSVEWFYHAAETAMEAAFLAGAPVIIAAQLVTASGSWASMAPDIPSGCLPRSVSISMTRGDTLGETVCNAVEVLLRGFGIEPGTADYAHKAQLSERSDAGVGRACAGHARRRAGVTPNR